MSTRPPLGQHFLSDPAVLEDLVAAINPSKDDVFVEVGPGTGVLTKPLLASGAKVIAIERDAKLIPKLKQNLRQFAKQLTIHHGDAAKELPVPQQPWRLVGNLPYAISSPLLTRLAKYVTNLLDVHVMLQHEFAQRLVSKPDCKDYGRLSVVVQANFAVEYLFAVAPTSFTPPPKVQSAVVSMHPQSTISPIVASEEFATITRLAFAQRRKQLANALASLKLPLDSQLGKLRAENLTVANYIELAQNFQGVRK